MLLLLLPAKFRGKINLPDKVVVYVNPLDAVAAGLVGFVDNDLVHKFMQELASGGLCGSLQKEWASGR